MTEPELPVGFTKDTGYQIGVRRTIRAPHKVAWDLVFSSAGLSVWLGPNNNLQLEEGRPYELGDGASGEVRVFLRGSHARLTWQPPGYARPSSIQVRVIDKGRKTVIAFHQEHLPDAKARESRRRHFVDALDVLEEQLLTLT